MIHEIALPALSESVVEGTIGRWLKHPGEALAAWEPLVEVETDKLTTDIPSPVAGVLLECCVAAGTTVMAGTVIARIRLHAAPGAVPPAGPEALPLPVAASLAQLFHPVLYPGVGSLLRITQQELGYLVGLSRQRVNEALQALQSARLIRVEYGGVRVLDLAGLRVFARREHRVAARA